MMDETITLKIGNLYLGIRAIPYHKNYSYYEKTENENSSIEQSSHRSIH